MTWQVLYASATAAVRRRGRFVVADLHVPHRVLSTSVKNGGYSETIGFLVNHQSCEGSGHDDRAHVILERGQDAHHDATAAEIDLAADRVAIMGTAANMNYAALAVERDEDVEVAAVVTAGVQTNATCAGDPAQWRERPDGTIKVPHVAGTINTMLLVSWATTAGVLARLAMTITEAKTAALQRLAVPSCYSPDLATGTGTDQFCIAAPLDGSQPLTSASSHMKFGEIVGLAVRRATLEALRWQNGLEPSYTRGLFHALGRYGLKEQTVIEDLTPFLAPKDLELLRRNSKSVFYEPLAGAAAYALASVLDRSRHGTLPESLLPEAAAQQAAVLAANLASQPERWPEFHRRLHDDGPPDAKTLALKAVALGWSEKWRTR